MNFKTYDILSSLVPGFLIMLVMLKFFGFAYDKDLVVAYTAIAFFLGYIMNTISSWAEDFYFWTWRGKPSTALLEGRQVWKVRFYHANKVRQLLMKETSNQNPTNDELFSIAMRSANGNASRVDDFNGMYAFSRVLLTTIILNSVLLLSANYSDPRYYIILLPMIFLMWLRCKQRGYYYAREVLNVYLKLKS